MNAHELATVFISLGILLLFARLFGSISKKYGQPAIIGELLAGVILGPTVFGRIYPPFTHFIYPANGPVASFLAGFFSLAVVFQLMDAGTHIRLAQLVRQS